MRRAPVATVLLLVVAVASIGCATLGLLESVESLLAQAKALLDAKRYDEALAKLIEVIRRDPMQGRAFLYSAQAYIGKLDWTSAITNARRAFELAPTDATALATLRDALWGGGRAALQRGAFGDAAALLVEYVKLRPTDPAGYLEAGRAYLGARDWSAAARVLTEGLARATDPKAYLQNGDTGEAFTALRRVLELAPQNEDARRLLLGR